VVKQAVSSATSAVCSGASFAKVTASAASRATLTQSVEIHTYLTWPMDCKYLILCSSSSQPLAGDLSKMSDMAAFTVQTVSVYHIFVAAGGHWHRWRSKLLKQAKSRSDSQTNQL